MYKHHTLLFCYLKLIKIFFRVGLSTSSQRSQTSEANNWGFQTRYLRWEIYHHRETPLPGKDWIDVNYDCGRSRDYTA